VPLVGTERLAPAITDERARELAALGGRVAAHYGAPQDLEWAVEGGHAYLVQSRPITTLFPLPAPEPDDGALHVYLSFGHLQVMTDALSPMALALFPELVAFGRPPGQPNPYLRSAASRLYIDPTALLAHGPFRRALPRLLGQGDAEISAGLRAIVGRPEFVAGTHRAAGQVPAPALARLFGRIAGRLLARLAWRRPEGTVREVEALLDGRLAADTAAIAATEPGAARLAETRRRLRALPAWFFPNLLPIVGAGGASRVLIERLAGARAAPADLAALARGTSGNAATEMDLAVGDLADLARAAPAVAERLRTRPPAEALQGLAERPGGAAFLAGWQAFLARYGMRGPGEIDIARPRWADDPAQLVQVVVGNLAAPAGAHRRRHAQLAAEAEAATARVVAASRHGVLGPLRAAVVGRLIRVHRHLMPAREHPKYFIIRYFGLLRGQLLDIADRLVAEGHLAAREEVWFLSLDEVAAALDGAGAELARRVAERRAAYEHDRHVTPPRILTSDGERPAVAVHPADLPPGVLAGTAASAGVVEGRAHVVRDPAREVLQAGEVLVAPFTDPGWTPLFINAAGLVLEVGGLMTHGSVVAREYGIPAVVGVPEATGRIRSGQRLRVDGDAGLVTVLAEAESPALAQDAPDGPRSDDAAADADASDDAAPDGAIPAPT
jgi:pyruvate,water dikinase